MKAIGIAASDTSGSVASLSDIEIPMPSMKPRDLLVKVEAVSVNPLDIRMRRAKPNANGEPRILGWDAAGTVVDVGAEVSLFKPSDRVYYAGSILRQGTNAEYHVVDERIVGRMPESIGYAEAAAMPLTTLAAWEALFDCMKVASDGTSEGRSVLIIGGAGGVGSVAIQLARRVAGLRVLTTASRPESKDWCMALGADIVLDHSADLLAQAAELKVRDVDYILCLSSTDTYFPVMSKLIRPRGQICALVESVNPLPMNDLRSKSVSFSWEGMFTRSMFQTPDMLEQHHTLTRVAALVDKGAIRATTQTTLFGLTAEEIRKAHRMLGEGGATGKIVVQV